MHFPAPHLYIVASLLPLSVLGHRLGLQPDEAVPKSMGFSIFWLTRRSLTILNRDSIGRTLGFSILI